MPYGELTPQTFDGQTVPAIKLTIPFPKKEAYVRLMTPDEMLQYLKGSQDKKKGQTAEERALEMFNKIRLDKGEEFDEYEATAALNGLLYSRGVSYEREGNAYRITLETSFGDTVHVLDIPTQKQLSVFRRNAVKNYLNAVVALYRDLAQSIEGYVDSIQPKDVPVYHMLDCVNQVHTALETLDPILPGAIDPNVINL